MTKALIDILEEERDLVQKIDTLSSHIKLISDRRVELLMRFTPEADYNYERSYLAYLQKDIDRMNAEKFTYQEKLVNTRRELSGYINYLSEGE